MLTTHPASLYNPAVDQFQSTTTTAAIWRERERERIVRPHPRHPLLEANDRIFVTSIAPLRSIPCFPPRRPPLSRWTVDGMISRFLIVEVSLSFFFFFFQVRCSRKLLERRGRVSGKTTCTMTTSIIEKRYNLVSGPCSSDSNRSLLLLPPYDFSLVISKRYFPFPVSFHRGQRGVIDRCLLFARGVRRCW